MKPCRPPGLEKWLLPTYVMEYAWVASPLFGNANCKLSPPQDDCLRCRVHPYCCSTSLLNQEETPPPSPHTPHVLPLGPETPSLLSLQFSHTYTWDIFSTDMLPQHGKEADQAGVMRAFMDDESWASFRQQGFPTPPPPLFFLRMRLIRATILASG